MVTKISGAVIAPGAITSDKVNTQSVTLAGPKISSIAVANSTWHVQDDTAVNVGGGYIVITGSNFDANATVTINGTTATSVSVVDAGTIRVEVPAKVSASYDVYVINGDDGRIAISPAGLTYSAFPAWATNATLTGQTSDIAFELNLATDISATFALKSGSSLPGGVTLLANGFIYGTVTGVTTATDYTFTVVATDAENQDIEREFTLPVAAPVSGGGEALFMNYCLNPTTSCWVSCCVNDYVNGQTTSSTWTVPPGVTSISVLTVGAGGTGEQCQPNNYGQGTTPAFAAGGGGLVWANDIPVTPGDVLQVGWSVTGSADYWSTYATTQSNCYCYDNVIANCATGAQAGGGAWVCKNGCWYVCATGGFPPARGTQGGAGSGCVSLPGGTTYCINCGGRGVAVDAVAYISGAGAAGYTGNGGDSVWTTVAGTCVVGNAGSGGGAGSGGVSPYAFDSTYYAAGGGGGVGVWGCGTSGAGGDPSCTPYTSGGTPWKATGGEGGSCGTKGAPTCFCFGQPAVDMYTLLYLDPAEGQGLYANVAACPASYSIDRPGVHGGGGNWMKKGGDGVVRIMWPGSTRGFPSTDAGKWCPNFIGQPTFQGCKVQDTVGSFTLCAQGTGVTFELAEGSTLPGTYTLCSNGYVYGTVTGLVSDTMYCFSVIATDCRGCKSSEQPACFCVWTDARGQWNSWSDGYPGAFYSYSATGCTCCFNFTVPDGVTVLSAVAVGGGGGSARHAQGHTSGGGGALVWGCCLPVTPGETLVIGVGSGGYACYLSSNLSCGGTSFVQSTTNGWCFYAGGGRKAAGGTYGGGGGSGSIGGGNGGAGYSGTCSLYAYHTGGGAGGYDGPGSNGFCFDCRNGANWGASNSYCGGRSGAYCGPGWAGQDGSVSGQGVSLYGRGCFPNCANICCGYGQGWLFGNNGYYGITGGGGAPFNHGQTGAVRIIWGPGRTYPAGAADI